MTVLCPRSAPHPTNRPRGPCIALQRLFPASFAGLVRVCNHKAADCLLVKHEAAASQRDRCECAVAAARQRAKVLGTGPAEAGAGAKGAGDAANGSSSSSKQAANASAKLSKAEAQLAKWQQRTAELEAQLLAAQQAALAQPLGTAFIALFRCVAGIRAAMVGGRPFWLLMAVQAPGRFTPERAAFTCIHCACVPATAVLSAGRRLCRPC